MTLTGIHLQVETAKWSVSPPRPGRLGAANREGVTLYAILWFRKSGLARRHPGVWVLAGLVQTTSKTFGLVGKPSKDRARFVHSSYPGSIRVSRVEEGAAKAVFFGTAPDQLLSAFMGWLARSGGERVERVEVFLDEPED